MTFEARRIRLIMMLRQSGVTDPRVLSAMELLPREEFVPEVFRDRAYEDTALPIGHGQTISRPAVVGVMTQALDVGSRMKVLEIGTGSGYQTAVLARLCRRVYTVEKHRPLMIEAEARFRNLRIRNVTSHVGDGGQGWRGVAPFDRILVAAASADVPEALVDQLVEGGVMILPIGARRDDQRLLRIEREGTGYKTEDLSATRFVPLMDQSTEVAFMPSRKR